MSVVRTDTSERSATQQSFDCHTARFTTQWPDETVGIITVEGELDASNATQFADHVGQCADGAVSLILDLSSLEFFGTAGFSALHTINVHCARTGSRWALVSGAAVARLLRVCDQDNALPVAASVPDGITLLGGEPGQLLQLVAESR